LPDAQIIVRVRPRAGKDELVEMREGVLIARVRAAPVDGAANRALCRLIAGRLRVAPSRVTIVRGERSREKLVRVDGIDTEALGMMLGLE
jgi:uncharacterized protein